METAAREEHQAWKQVCRQLAVLDVDINAADALTLALKLWAWKWHRLASNADLEEDLCVETAEDEYEPHWIDEDEVAKYDKIDDDT